MPPLEKYPAGYPKWMRWLSFAWFAVWFPTYWRTWGGANFAHLCDVAVILTCIGMWTNNGLLISSQAVGALLIDAAWALDAFWILVLHHPLIGGNEYLLDDHYAVWIRLLTLFHLVMPGLLLWGVYRLGYDRWGWLLQCAIALPVLIAARFTPLVKNIDFAFSDPFFHRAWGPAPTHILVVWLFMALVVYLPTHLVLRRISRSPDEQP